MTKYPTIIGAPPQLSEETVLIKTSFQYDDIQIGGSQEKGEILVPETPVFPLIKVCAYRKEEQVWTYDLDFDEWVEYDAELHLIPTTKPLVEAGTPSDEFDSLYDEPSAAEGSPISEADDCDCEDCDDEENDGEVAAD